MASNDLNEITIQGTVVDIIFENDENGYKICEIFCQGQYTVTARGTLPFLFVGEIVSLTGHFENHKVYGDQFIVSEYVKTLPDNIEDIETFLSSGLIEGVGPATAKAIVKKFGIDTIRVILHTPDRLESVRGITHLRALRISDTFKEYEQMSDLIVFFNKYGISTGIALKIYQKYGGLAVEFVRKNPYRLIDDIPEIGFKTADRIGLSIGVHNDAGSRICAGILHVLSLGISTGHCCLPEDQLILNTSSLLELEQSVIQAYLDTLQNLGRIQCVGETYPRKIFLAYMYMCESYISRRLLMLARNNSEITEEYFTGSVRDFESDNQIDLDDTQIDAIKTSSRLGFSVITGGPGTGKTTIIKALVHILTGRKKKCVLAAPTGRAAKRMTETCGLPSKTIHRLLEFSAIQRDDDLIDEKPEDMRLEFGRNEKNPLDLSVLIIDEASMVDTLLFYHLLKAVPEHAQVILVGDKDQLPSVGPGNILKDIIQSNVFHITTLNTIYRQETQSMIAYNAHRINQGLLPEFNLKDRDFFLLTRNTPDDTIRTLLDVVCRRLPQTYGLNPMEDIQVIIPNKKGVCGVINANILLQQQLNPPASDKKEYTSGAGIFREGDRVMQIKNNYEIEWFKRDQIGVAGKGIFNGEMGIILAIDSKNKTVQILFDDDRVASYEFTCMNQIEHCYAITVHKSQGSEFDYCVIPVLSGPPMLMTRNILYTAITRAKKMVVLVGNGYCIETMVSNNKEQIRHTHLKEQIIEGSDTL